MRLIALLLSFCFTFNVLAASGSVSELERALDEYQYTMTVEWDQKDQEFHEKVTKAFFDKMGVLVSEQGLHKEEVLAFAEKKMANKKAFEALKLKLSLLSEVKSSDELARVLRENSKEFYVQGASWAPDATEVLIWVGIAALIGYLVWFNANYECGGYEEVWECDTYTNSDGTHSSTSCGWETQCAYYVEK